MTRTLATGYWYGRDAMNENWKTNSPMTAAYYNGMNKLPNYITWPNDTVFFLNDSRVILQFLDFEKTKL